MQHQVVDSSAEIAHFEMVQARNDVLDAFSDLETQIHVFLKAGKHPVNGQHLGSKIEVFKKLQVIPQIAKTNFSKRDALADEIVNLLAVRADIVHSRMQVSIVDGVSEAIFTNSQYRNDPYPLCRIVNVEQMRILSASVLRIVHDLKGLSRSTNPASSPLPPSPGAAGDP